MRRLLFLLFPALIGACGDISVRVEGTKDMPEISADVNEGGTSLTMKPKPIGFVVTVPTPFYAGARGSCLVERMPE